MVFPTPKTYVFALSIYQLHCVCSCEFHLLRTRSSILVYPLGGRGDTHRAAARSITVFAQKHHGVLFFLFFNASIERIQAESSKSLKLFTVF
jgi:hypothetical protein